MLDPNPRAPDALLAALADRLDRAEANIDALIAVAVALVRLHGLPVAEQMRNGSTFSGAATPQPEETLP
jgi:hypothetical protein